MQNLYWTVEGTFQPSLFIQWNLSNPPHLRGQRNVSDCTGCQNTQVLFQLEIF